MGTGSKGRRQSGSRGRRGVGTRAAAGTSERGSVHSSAYNAIGYRDPAQPGTLDTENNNRSQAVHGQAARRTTAAQAHCRGQRGIRQAPLAVSEMRSPTVETLLARRVFTTLGLPQMLEFGLSLSAREVDSGMGAALPPETSVKKEPRFIPALPVEAHGSEDLLWWSNCYSGNTVMIPFTYNLELSASEVKPSGGRAPRKGHKIFDSILGVAALRAEVVWEPIPAPKTAPTGILHFRVTANISPMRVQLAQEIGVTARSARPFTCPNCQNPMRFLYLEIVGIVTKKMEPNKNRWMCWTCCQPPELQKALRVMVEDARRVLSECGAAEEESVA